MTTMESPTQSNKRAITLTNIRQPALNLVVLLAWLWLYRGMFGYFSVIFGREDFRTNQWVLLGVGLLIAFQIRSGTFRPRLAAAPRLFWPGLALALGGSALYLLEERFFDINTISASLFALAGYGLLGLWMQPHQWRQGLPAALLLMGTLPFGDHMQTFIGYPMRIFTAGIVRDGLAAAGIGSVGVDTILILENGVSQIDLPCSGVKSLWTGMLFLIAATWIEQRRLDGRWLVIAAVFSGLLFGVNLIRVGILVLVGQVQGWMLAAEMLHIPLGVLGFVAACAAVMILLRRQPSLPSTPPTPTVIPLRPRWLAPVLVITFLAMGLLYAQRPQTGLTHTAQPWNFPSEFTTTPLPLKPDEQEWFTRDGAESADRFRFEWQHGEQRLTGSMILVTSRTWRAHHRPERCFEVYGLTIDNSHPHLVNPGFPLRLVSLGDGEGRSLLSAAYWFQSPTRTTDDYATRIWADLSPQRDRWMLVSILFDEVHNPNTKRIEIFYTQLQKAVIQHLNESASQ